MGWSSLTGWNGDGWSRPALVAATAWNNLDKNANLSLTNSNLTVTVSSTGYQGVRAVASASTGLFYYEVHLDTNPTGELILAGIANATFGVSSGNFAGQDNNSIGFDPDGSLIFLNGVTTAAAHGVTGDTIGIAVDIAGTSFKCNVNGGAFTTRSFATMGAGPYFPLLTMITPGTRSTAAFSSASWLFSPPAGGYGQWQ